MAPSKVHWNAVKTHCPQGHAFQGSNLYVTRKGERSCRTCQRERPRRLKIEVLSHYSNGKPFCAGCGFGLIEALQIDHLENNGAAEKKMYNHNGGHNCYVILKRRGFPEGYQVLCANCNLIKQARFLKSKTGEANA